MSRVYFSSDYCRIRLSLFLPFLFLLFLNNATAQRSSKKTDRESTFTAQLINIEAAVNKPFRYRTTLHNGSSEDQVYTLMADIPDGWNAIFRARGSQVTSINIKGGQSESITLELHAAYGAKPSKYKIPVIAKSNDNSLHVNLEAVVEGSYGMELTTPTGRLSDEITEGKQKEIQLEVKNTASLPLKDIKISTRTPPEWSATMDPSKIDQLAPGETRAIKATLNVPDKTIVGDYMSTFTAKSPNANEKASFRMKVVTSMLTGWIGILVILLAIALVYFLIRKYGRR